MLEDDFTYVVRKALAGNGLSPEEAATHAGIRDSSLRDFIGGSFSPETARAIAPVLGLNAEALTRHPAYQPKPTGLPDIERLSLPFGQERVNAWIVRSDDMLVLFDTGFDASDLTKALHGRTPERVFITHSHRDHIGAVPTFLSSGIPVHSADLPGTIHMKPGDAVICGPLVIRACDLSGHYSPSLGFGIEGLAQPALVTGDALFAGSIGGCRTPASYRQALASLRRTLSQLPNSTVLLPGHGPATTLGEERVSNPFL